MGKRHFNRSIIGLVSIISSTLLMFACQGPTGTNGKDSRLTDSLPPTIEWIAPIHGTIADTSLTLQVHASDNLSVYKVSFYVGGFEFAGVLSDSISQVYSYEWESLTYPEGPYPLMARVWDESRQTATTPVRVVEVKH